MYGTTEALRGLITLKIFQCSQGFSGVSGSADAQIDTLVYEVYELAEEEITLIEEQ